jgi:hypothetical protein
MRRHGLQVASNRVTAAIWTTPRAGTKWSIRDALDVQLLVTDEEVFAGDAGAGARQAQRPARAVISDRGSLPSTFNVLQPDLLPFGSQADPYWLPRHRSPYLVKAPNLSLLVTGFKRRVWSFCEKERPILTHL